MSCASFCVVEKVQCSEYVLLLFVCSAGLIEINFKRPNVLRLFLCGWTRMETTLVLLPPSFQDRLKTCCACVKLRLKLIRCVCMFSLIEIKQASVYDSLLLTKSTF